jgi:hypothetical protein
MLKTIFYTESGNGMSSEDRAAIADNGWALAVDLPIGGLRDTSLLPVYLDLIDQSIAAGIPTIAQIENCIGGTIGPAGHLIHPDPLLGNDPQIGPWYYDSTTTAGEYATLFEPGMTLLEERDLFGYLWEGAYDACITWLRGATSKKLMQYLSRENWYAPSSAYYLFGNFYINTGHPCTGGDACIDCADCFAAMDWRISQVDYIIHEIFYAYDTAAVTALGQNMRLNWPTKKYGYNTYYGNPSNTPLGYWGVPTILEAKDLIITSLTSVIDTVGLDYLDTLYVGPYYSNIIPIGDYISFFDYLSQETPRIDLTNIVHPTS